MSVTIWTIGHSTRAIDEFCELLRVYGIQHVTDVRRYPGSRWYPWFNRESLASALKDVEIRYRHLPALGGRRQPSSESLNLGWRNSSFRGYADYMQGSEFRGAVEELMAYGQTTRTAIICAEAVPWRCHRSLIADALVSHGWTVHHILSADRADRHVLTPFARVTEGRILYPADS